MQFTLLAAASLLAASVSAFEVLTPTLNATVAKGKTVSVEWSSVDTDSEVFSVYLTNFLSWPPVVLSLAQNVPRDDASIDLRVPCDLGSGEGWQINFINGTNTYVIYAQSPSFSLTGDCVEPAPTPAPYPTGYTNTTTQTLPGTTVTIVATSTATLCKTVSTVVYATPIVWFVEPSKEAACAAVAKETVTVYNGGVAPVTCASVAGPKPTSVSGVKPTVPAGGAGVPGVAQPTVYPTITPTAAPTGGVFPTKKAEFTGAASTLQASGLIAVVIGAVAFLL